jgi:hypothetical protein
MADGYNAQILWVDLTEGRTEIRELGEEVMRKYIGGAGLAAKILWEETSKDTEPFVPENLLIFMTGPLTGVVQQSSRYIVAGISPLTNIWGRAHSGGSWADKLRRSGFMGIVCFIIAGLVMLPLQYHLPEIKTTSHGSVLGSHNTSPCLGYPISIFHRIAVVAASLLFACC